MEEISLKTNKLNKVDKKKPKINQTINKQINKTRLNKSHKHHTKLTTIKTKKEEDQALLEQYKYPHHRGLAPAPADDADGRRDCWFCAGGCCCCCCPAEPAVAACCRLAAVKRDETGGLRAPR